MLPILDNFMLRVTRHMPKQKKTKKMQFDVVIEQRSQVRRGIKKIVRIKL